MRRDEERGEGEAVSYRRKFKADGFTDDLGEPKLCPKCGSEMEPAVRVGDPLEIVRVTCFNCGYEKKVRK